MTLNEARRTVSNQPDETSTPTFEADEAAELLRETLLRLQPSSREISEAWSSAQVTMQQFRVMTILYHEGPTRVSDLALRLDVSTPTITGILDRLVKQKISYRMSDPRDRRVVLNNLTGEGRDLVERLQPAHGKQIERAIGKLNANEREQLTRSLRALLRAIPV
ncbi:MAG: MarR family transcriptional regulator [Chloroflexota bacterium]